MNQNEITQFCAKAAIPNSVPYIQTFKETSKTKNGNYCLKTGYASSLSVVSYDDVVNKWTGTQFRISNGKNAMCSVDALYVENGKLFLIEFKRLNSLALDRQVVKFHRKVYDSIILLVEHGFKTFQQSISDVTYIIVSTGMPRLTSEDIHIGYRKGLTSSQRILMQQQLFNSIPGCLSRPWRYTQVRAHYGLGRLEDVLYKKALTLTPCQFNLFAQDNGWL